MLALGATATFSLAAFATGCSSSNDSSPPPGPAACDPTKCAAGNTCITLNGETRCRRVCSSNVDPQTSCAFGYTCVAPQSGEQPFCIQDQALNDDGSFVKKTDKGQWGATCNPAGGRDDNPDCDTAQGFKCFARSPVDGNAYCTRYDCESDRNCGAGFWCGAVNSTPNAVREKRKESEIGQVRQVCLKREQCATCQVDFDCPPVNGRNAHCVTGDDGANFCAVECTDAGTCRTEDKCANFGDFKACFPRARTCVGDGSLCSPCRSDADCGEDGACVRGERTTEYFCAKKSKGACAAGSCPTSIPMGSKQTGCVPTDDGAIPANYCVGLYSLGGDFVPGCYSPTR